MRSGTKELSEALGPGVRSRREASLPSPLRGPLYDPSSSWQRLHDRAAVLEASVETLPRRTVTRRVTAAAYDHTPRGALTDHAALTIQLGD